MKSIVLLVVAAAAVSTGGVPAIEVGTFQLQNSSDPDWLHDEYIVTSNGSFTGFGNGSWGSGVVQPYTYYGAGSQYNCTTTSSSEAVQVSKFYWFHDEVMFDDPNSIQVNCVYRTFHPDGPILAHQFQGNSLVNMNDFVEGTCPDSVEQALTGDGLEWMPNGFNTREVVFQCVNNCYQSRDCALVGAPTMAPTKAPTSSSSAETWVGPYTFIVLVLLPLFG